MADRFLLEASAVDGYQLEDASGVLLDEQPVDFLCGWECGIVTVGAAAVPAEYHWPAGAGNPAISTTTVRTGTRSLRCNPAAANSYLGRVIARRIVAGRVYINVASFPIAQGNIVTCSLNTIRLSTSGQITISGGTGAPSVNVGSPISLNTWYRLDWLADTSTGTSSMKCRLDGGTEAESTVAVAAADMTNIRIGFVSTATADVFYDDLIVGSSTADYPFGAGKVEGLHPDSDGTHSFTLGDFQYDDLVNIPVAATDVWTFVDDADLTGVTDYIRQVVIRSTGYVEVGFQSPVATTAAQAITVVSSWHAAGTGANTIGLKINDGGTLATVTNPDGDGLSDFSNTTVTFDERTYTSAPSGGAWTNAKLVALKARMGYSTDVTDNPYWDGITLEVGFATGVGGVVDGAIALNGTGNLGATGSALMAGTTGLNGSGQIGQGGTALYAGTAALSGTGQIGLLGGFNMEGTVGLNGTGQIGQAGTALFGGGVGLNGTGNLGASAAALMAGTLPLSGTGQIGQGGTALLAGTAALLGTGNLGQSGGLIAAGTLALNGTGNLGATSTATYAGTLGLNGIGNLGLETRGILEGAIALNGSGNLGALGSARMAGSAAYGGQGNLGQSAAALMGGGVAYAGSGNLTAGGTALRAGIVALGGTGNLGALGSARLTGIIALNGIGNLTANGALLPPFLPLDPGASGSVTQADLSGTVTIASPVKVTNVGLRGKVVAK